MKKVPSRREALKTLGVSSAGLLVGGGLIRGQGTDIIVAGQPVEIAVSSESATTVRLTVRPLVSGRPGPMTATGALARHTVAPEAGKARPLAGTARVRAGDMVVRFTDSPPTLHVETAAGTVIQRLTLDAAAPGFSFPLPKGPLLGLGEGGVQFDKKGSTDQMRNGQVTSQADGYRLAIHGTRAPIQWLIGTTDGWAMFIDQPYGTFDFKGPDGKFAPPATSALPLDVFIVHSRDPLVIMREYARITGQAEMPPLWAFGYMQSHRTLGGPDEILGVARTFREKKLPCDTLIYLGTEFAPSGWNTRNGEFTWHTTNFPDPKKMLDQLHAEHFRVVVHVVIEGRRFTGTVEDPCTAPALPPGRTEDNRWPPERQVSCYWPVHKSIMDVGVDGWWPDQGDGFDGPSRLLRHRMYWEGTQLFRPNERPFALHRNASAGIQRYGGFIWSGDVQSRWETLATHVGVAINSGLSGLPYWGTDIGGFVPTTEYTGELHARWFQFGAFCPSFRAHGRNWHLKLPWGWDGGDGGPPETNNFKVPPEELKNARVEPICRKYLELRYRLMPYLQTVIRESHDTGLPIMRALWLHHADDEAAVGRGDEYLWGRDMLVAPVVQAGATSRRLYLPRGAWIDFWTNERVEGGREIDRAVDLETMPLYVRAGAVLPLGPVKQYVDQQVQEPASLVVYPGANGSSSLYEDDGRTFAYRQGAWMRMEMTWQDQTRTLTLRLAPGSRMLPPAPRRFTARLAGSTDERPVTFNGRPVTVRFS
ncbi:MAG TPA: TIM-barrel domain-containing protein [Vicinamibacterales bacterium]|nr:TIM-barrel domain-containing protein [Vicinamibacterales bacterium]